MAGDGKAEEDASAAAAAAAGDDAAAPPAAAYETNNDMLAHLLGGDEEDEDDAMMGVEAGAADEEEARPAAAEEEQKGAPAANDDDGQAPATAMDEDAAKDGAAAAKKKDGGDADDAGEIEKGRMTAPVDRSIDRSTCQDRLPRSTQLTDRPIYRNPHTPNHTNSSSSRPTAVRRQSRQGGGCGGADHFVLCVARGRPKERGAFAERGPLVCVERGDLEAPC